MECNVCLNEWSEQKCIPRMLPCGHSFCGDCLLLLFKPSSKELTCPKCLVPHKAESADKVDKAFPKNWALIALADSHKPTPPLLQMRKGMSSARNGVPTNQLFQSLGASSVKLVWARQRGNSDQILSSGRKYSTFEQNDEEWKSEEEMKRVGESEEEPTEEESSEEESKEIVVEKHIKSKRNKGISVLQRRHSKNECSQDGGEEKAGSEECDGDEGEDLSNIQEPFLLPHAKCPKHGLPIHSFEKRSKELLCTQCVQESNIPNDLLQVFPQAVREIKEKVQHAKDLNKQRRMQLASVMAHLSDAQAKNRKEIKASVAAHRKQIQKVLEEYDRRIQKELVDAMQKQEVQLRDVEQKISENLDELCNNDICLQSLGVHEDCFLIYMTRTIDDLYDKQVNFTPKIDNLNEVLIDLHMDEQAPEKLERVLSEAHGFKFDTIREDQIPLKKNSKENPFDVVGGQMEEEKKEIADNVREDRQQAPPLSIAKMIDNDDHWLCTRCGNRQPGGEIICDKCLRFMPLTFFKNIVHSPDDATAAEINAVKARRKLERKLVIEAEKAGHGLQSQSNIWYMISNKWLYKWKSFVQNQVTLNNFFDNEEWAASVEISPNKKVGVLPPGMISNEEDFFIQQGPSQNDPENQQAAPGTKQLELKQGLRVNINYRAVNPNVWYLFYTNYGGASTVPTLAREAIDIYSRDMSHIIKIYYGKGNILPQHKLAALLLIGQEISNQVLHKKEKNKDKAAKAITPATYPYKASSQRLRQAHKSSQGRQREQALAQQPAKFAILSKTAGSFSQIEQLLSEDSELSFR